MLRGFPPPPSHSRRFKGEGPIGAATGEQTQPPRPCAPPPPDNSGHRGKKLYNGGCCEGSPPPPLSHSRGFKGEGPIGAATGEQTQPPRPCAPPSPPQHTTGSHHWLGKSPVPKMAVAWGRRAQTRPRLRQRGRGAQWVRLAAPPSAIVFCTRHSWPPPAEHALR